MNKSYSVVKCYFSVLLICVCVSVSAEALKLQQDQGEEKTSKIKQLLVKTKKDLADAKKQVCVCTCDRLSLTVCCITAF